MRVQLICLLGKTLSGSIVCARQFVWFITLHVLISCQAFREEAESNLLRSLIHLQAVLWGAFQTPHSHWAPIPRSKHGFPPHWCNHPATQLDSTAPLSHSSQGMGQTLYRLQLAGECCKTFPKVVPVHRAKAIHNKSFFWCRRIHFPLHLPFLEISPRF